MHIQPSPVDLLSCSGTQRPVDMPLNDTTRKLHIGIRTSIRTSIQSSTLS